MSRTEPSRHSEIDSLAASDDGHRIRLIVRYDGHDFHGWQKQEPPNEEPLRTAQGVLESAVRRAVREPVNVMGASRTDSGVHAEGQVAALTAGVEMKVPIERLHLAINRYLPPDIAVVRADRVPIAFQPISDATCKAYRYTIHNEHVPPVFDRHRVFHCWYDLDVSAMNDAAAMLVGEHDFESFANTQHGRESTIRTVFSCSVSRDMHRSERIHIDISGNGFLYHMVRIIGGTLVEVGRGHWTPDEVKDILAARDRRRAGPTLPPEGLCLMRIRYDELDES